MGAREGDSEDKGRGLHAHVCALGVALGVCAGACEAGVSRHSAGRGTRHIDGEPGEASEQLVR